MRAPVFAAAAVFGVLACAATRGERSARAEARAETAPPPAAGEQPLEELARGAESQEGRVTAITDDELRLQTYGSPSQETSLEISAPEIPVFVKGARVGRDALQQGDDVRVFYESGRGANPRVVAVELLGDDEARRPRESR
jgi:hypothetical protein